MLKESFEAVDGANNLCIYDILLVKLLGIQCLSLYEAATDVWEEKILLKQPPSGKPMNTVLRPHQPTWIDHPKDP